MSDNYTNRPPIAGVVLGRDEVNPDITRSIKVNNSGQLVVGGETSSSSSNFFVEETYFRANKDAAEYNTDDRILKRELIDTTGSEPNQVTWFNSTQGGTISEPPPEDLVLDTNSGLTDAQLRASDVGVIDQTAVDKLDEVKAAIDNIFGNTDDLEALANSQIQLLTTLNEYNDGVEGLLNTISGSTDDLESLLTQLGLNTDELEVIQSAIRDRLPSELGPQEANNSLSVVISGESAAPLANNAATETKQDDIITNLTSIDDKTPELDGGSVPVTGPLTDAELRASEISVSDANTQSKLADIETAQQETRDRLPSELGLQDANNSLSVIVSNEISTDLANNAATETKQDDIITNLSSIDTKTPELDGGSVPVTGPLTDAELRANSVSVSDSDALTKLTDLEVAQQETRDRLPENIGLQDANNSLSVVVSNEISTELANNAATETKQDDIITNLSSIDTKTPELDGGSVPVTGPLTDSELRATDVNVSDANTHSKLADVELAQQETRDRLPENLGPQAANDSLSIVFSDGVSSLEVTGPLTDAELRASEVSVADATVASKLDDVKSSIDSVFTNTDELEALANSQIQLLTTLNEYNDGVEGLLTAIGNNTDDLESLLTQLGLNTDDLETIQSAIRDRLPAELGPQDANNSLSVVISDEISTSLANNAATEETLVLVQNDLNTLQTEYSFNNANWEYTYTSDANGNITSETREATISGNTVSETRTYTWDSNNNIQSISAWT